MKKMLICCGVLCMTLLLFCGTALAKTEVKPGTDSSATVTADESGQKFTVSKTGVTKGDLYKPMAKTNYVLVIGIIIVVLALITFFIRKIFIKKEVKA